ncbi:hypothetical protein HJC23_007213 [Cyclotella cryptica]|uniref:Endonuclease/exonuclease/phosphatase domain-containing protein n=1 Tax=Cyclotella cryptica TaxID=29204 RepID=A0ABD3QQ01_9STRA|eukprot:CCRYP_003501-RA/>CCRYP_003501-RA protein AED:0.00 eAED:0.00 QI:133/-1/1/1/-1/1/1/79/356
MIVFFQDLSNFLRQLLPNPIAVFLQYRFSPADFESLNDVGRKQLSSSCVDTNSILFTFDMLSYNINNVASSSPSRTRLILRAIFSSGANIILLQETNPAWEKLLQNDAAALQFDYIYFHHPRLGDKDRPPDRPAGGMAILSQYALKDIGVLDFTKDVSGSVFPALICKAIVPLSQFSNEVPHGLNDVCISIANVHLRPPVELDGRAWLSTARKTEPIRLAEIKGLVRRVMSAESSLDTLSAPQHELDIIGGDFNEDNSGAALSYLSTTLGYIDALQQYVPKMKETHTWPFMRNLLTLRKRLDHILWRNELLSVTTKGGNTVRMLRLKCLGCGVITGFETGASDHQPVLSRFGIVME